MKRALLIITTLLLLPVQAWGEPVVIVNRENPVEQLSPREISDIFLCRRRSFPSGAPVFVIEEKRNGPLRETFFRLLNGMTLKRLNTYWARLQFSGEVQPHPSLPHSRDILAAVRENRDAIGYVDEGSLDGSVKVILRLKEK